MTRLAVQSLGRPNLSEAVFAGPPAHAKPARLADAVRLTLGPKSKSVLIQKKWGTPIVCNDGVTIAKEMELEDPEENLGAQMLRQAAEKTGEKVGNGTSTATVLAYAILADGVRNVVAGASAIDLERGLDRGLAAAVQALKSLAKPVDSRKEKAQVGTISALMERYEAERAAKRVNSVVAVEAHDGEVILRVRSDPSPAEAAKIELSRQTDLRSRRCGTDPFGKAIRLPPSSRYQGRCRW
jgi:hypothetical protein